MQEDLIGIGDFAARTRLSPKALRLYDERGLLPPARVDPRTGFRRYTAAQVERARRIALLRATGMPLARIAEVLDAGDGEAVRLLAAYWRQQESAHAARREAVGYAREILTGRSPYMYEIVEREVPEQKVLFLQRHVTAADLPAFLAESTELLFSHLRRAEACLSGPLFAVYHGLVSEDSDGPVELCAPTRNAVEPAGRIGVRIEPAHREAYTALTKRPDGDPSIPAAHDAVAAWLTAHGHSPTAPNREVYYPNWATAKPGEHVADVAAPFREGEGESAGPDRVLRAQ
ncbi:MerR family transcriptional regulator [Streptomyces sp. NBC_00525]|uniref:MerR family transcriptional regulator n=1 Tax=Streptomyces sp. NBC_00525 TaxID=2903660 RepID=UPI002E81A2E7|nr:MerR family transcriptional regulator [Streptomyces sp. NBC_00525]WUC95587.1 MerR family transcriptional regulator [Streptomyces sp. NBC_00525]